jgi:hypothetical protein
MSQPVLNFGFVRRGDALFSCTVMIASIIKNNSETWWDIWNEFLTHSFFIIGTIDVIIIVLGFRLKSHLSLLHLLHI